MDRDDLRMEALEHRVRRLERRLDRLEAPERSEPGPLPAAPPPPPSAPPSWRPPAPAGPQLPTFVPAPLAPASAAVPGWAATTRQLNPEPSPAGSPPVPQVPAWGASPGWGAARASAPSPRPALSLRDLEERFAGRALAWVGGLALVAAAVFFLSLAFSRGWINEPMRVLVGLAVGIAAFAGGAVMLARRNPLMGNVLSAVGLGIISVALMAATRLYGLVIPEVGLAGALVAAVAAAVIAIRFDAREVAAFGLVAALAAPPITGAAPTTLTLLFVAATLVGTTAISLFRSWRWLPPLAFVLAAPQLAGWVLGDPEPVQALIALAGFWLVNVTAAAGEEIRVRRNDLRPSSATLVLASATFLLWGGFTVLGGDLAGWRGAFVVAASLAHLLVGGWFLARQGLGHLFGNLVAGTALALLAIAAFVQLGAAVVPLAWAAEGTALAWIAARRRHRWSGVASLALGTLVVAHLVLVEYPLWEAGIRTAPAFSPPFLHPEAGSLGAVLVAAAVAGALVPVRWVRSALAGVGILLVAWATGFELAGTGLVGLLALLLPVGVIGDRGLGRLPDDPRFAWLERRVRFVAAAGAAGIISWAAAALVALARYLDPLRWGTVTPPPVPFLDERALAAALLAAAALAAARWTTGAAARRAGIVAAIIVAAIVVPYEVFADGVVVVWVALAVVALAMARLDAAGAVAHRAVAAVLVAGGAVVAWSIVAPPYRLWVGDPVLDLRPALLPAWPLSFLAIAGGLLVATRDAAVTRWRGLLQAGAGFGAVYLVSVGVVAAFAALVGGTIALEELRTQAQVALSVCWTGIGAGALVVGLAKRRPMLRHAGFALLGVATAKVFVIDLAAMDVAYRALVLAGLGILLLGSAFLFTHYRGPRSARPG